MTTADASTAEASAGSAAETAEERRARVLAARARRKAQAAADEDPAEVAATTRAAVRKTMTIMLTAAAVMALLNAQGLVSWAYDLEGSATSDVIVAGVEGWRELLEPVCLPQSATAWADGERAPEAWFDGDGVRICLNNFTDPLNDQIQAWRDTRWDDLFPADGLE